MATSHKDFSEADPFIVRKSPEETGGEFMRLELTMYPHPEKDSSGVDLPHDRWALDAPFGAVEHIHPDQEEWWKVLSGELRVEFKGEVQTLTEGDEITVPKNTPHRHFNPSTEPARVLFERRPALETAEWAESLYTLARLGKTKPDGSLRLPHLILVVDKYPETYLTSLPIPFQKSLFGILAPVVRVAGYEATHSREKIPANERI